MPNQKGYIALVLLIFGLIILFLLNPKTYPALTNKFQGCMIGESPSQNKEIDLPLINGRDLPPGSGGGPDTSQTKKYRLVRQNVPIVKDYILFNHPIGEHTVFYQNTPDNKYAVFYPGTYGEFDFYREFNAKRYKNFSPETNKNNQFFFRLEGLLFLVHLDNSGKMLEPGEGYYLMDVYQDLDIINLKDKDYTIEDVFRCPAAVTNNSDISVVFPKQSPSTDSLQQQLQWFVFQAKSGGTFGAHCKPAIYLYPKEKTLVNVKVQTKGFLTYTDPVYDSKLGWNVTAFPDGNLTTSYPLPTTNYPYLYYESKVPDKLIEKPKKGYVVKFEDLENLYKNILPKLGLNQQQTEDFVTYWKKALPAAPYYLVGVLGQDNVNSFEPLEITPKPDVVNRVRIYFEALDAPINVENPNLSNYPLPTTNYQLKVVEWGGMVKRDKNYPFTCSQ